MATVSCISVADSDISAKTPEKSDVVVGIFVTSFSDVCGDSVVLWWYLKVVCGT